MANKKDNSTFVQKTAIRRNLLKDIASPIVMETHAGYGKIWERCYSKLPGVAFETDPIKARELSTQRPTWAIYQSDCEGALLAGVGAHIPVNVLDCDPYGSPWQAIFAFFQSERPFPSRVGVVVNDGLRLKSKRGGLWTMPRMAEVVQRFGNDECYARYLDICQEMVKKASAQRGYTLRRWAGYYCGYDDQMTHYAAVLERQ